ncbi:exported protein [Bordetella pertussis]|nr:exported protein [Bordetella pertussis]
MVSGLFRIGALLAAGLLCGGAWAQDAEADPYGDPIVAPRAAPPQWKPLKIDPPGHRYAFPSTAARTWSATTCAASGAW